MSVFTSVSRDDLQAFVADYGFGDLVGFQGIDEGSENSNFFVSLSAGEYVLTLVERGPEQDLPFFIALLEVLHQARLPVPYALADRHGRALRRLNGRPALLQPRLNGRHVRQPNAQHCAQVGDLLASIHVATRGDILRRETDRGWDWMLAEAPAQLARLPAGEGRLLERALDELAARQQAIRALPQANLHADLFRDNVMFDGAQLSGVIDFYNACAGPMLYDLAITFNDWCSSDDGAIDERRGRALLGAYAARRSFEPAEAELWPALLRIACLRFWLSRALAAQANAGQQVLIHDPAEFQRRLAARQQVALALPFAL